MEMATRPRRAVDCELEWGHAFEMTAKGSAGRICHGDTVMDPSLPVLAYGEVWQRGGFTLPLGADGIDLLQRHAARIFAVAGGADGILKDGEDAAIHIGDMHAADHTRHCTGVKRK